MSDTPREGGEVAPENAAEELGALLFAEMDEEGSSTPDDDKKPQEAKSEAESNDETPESDEADPEDDDAPEEDDIESDDEPDDVPTEPQLASDEAIVDLGDGTRVTVGELKRGNLREGDYTRKTQELAAQRKEFEDTQSRVTQHEQALANERQMMATFVKANMPQEPDPEMLNDDPVGYMQEKARYDQQMGQLREFAQKEADAVKKAQEEQKAEQQKYIDQQREMLHAAMPEMKDPAKFQEFWNGAQGYLTGKGFTAEEVQQNLVDHRFYKILKDAIAYQGIQQAKPKAKAKAEGKPAVMNSDRRKGRKAGASKSLDERIAKAEKSGDPRMVADILGNLLMPED
ncbi:hypothetical protein [Breoghania sp.]|uniref:hypothetical protein n=1 Tax=Breoghania sp. TaxID=2065378 RepID=UPI0026298ABA|nr:hypothetical protein [Breoghania sp.]MDJ0933731.1 hypothetical protein [Breoghania sp.]